METMASSASRPTFSLHLSPSLSHPKPQKTHLPFFHPPLTKSHPISTHHTPTKYSRFIAKSRPIDVSEEDKPIIETPQLTPNQDQPISQNPNPSAPTSDSPPNVPPKPITAARPEEKFVVLNTGVHECRSCGYLYDAAAGDPLYPAPAGMAFSELPADWRCPTCGAAKVFFESKSVEIAGFAQNQQFGLGGNALTSGQKALLIYGGLLFFFVLFVSGYFLQ